MVKMKDSGIEWIGEIPEKWKAVPIYTCTSEITQKNFDLKEKRALKFTYGNIVDKNNFNIDEDPALTQTASNYLVVKPNDIVINGLNLNYDFVTQRVGMVNNNGIITSAYIGIRTNQAAVIPKYLLYLFKTYDAEKAFHNMGGGVRKILNYSELKKEKVILPSVVQQRFIADFLDKKCADIDKLSEQIQREIEALQKYRKSVITNAVTKGLDDNVPMKDSGIDWIGKIPEDWKIIPLKYTIKNKTDVLKETTDPDFEFLYVDIGSVVTGYINNYQLVRFKNAPSRARKVVRDKDVIISTVRTYLKAIASIKTKNLPIIVSTGFAVLRSNGKINPDFLRYAVENESFVSQVQINSVGINYPAISQSKLLNLKIVFPPMDVQIAINKYLDNKTYQIDRMISQKKKQLSLLSDYKNSLIFEYVTGKKQVGEE